MQRNPGSSGRYRRFFGLALCVTLISACASVPFDYPRTASHALPPSADTHLGQLAGEWSAQHGAQSGFLGLPSGVDALGARLRLMERAEQTIDAQYFIIKKDEAGALFAGKLLRAADRGVRVRLLVDDIFTPGTDQAFSLLNSHPNIEVRLFNPVANRRFKYLSYAADFKRANRRMHNKSFTVDNAMSIVGGRNIGEEYFELNQDVAFDDYEVLTIGPVVEKISRGFDKFWNSELSVPMKAYGIEVFPGELDAWREYIAGQIDKGDQGIYARAVNSSFFADLSSGAIKPVAAPAVMITDSPDKLLAEVGDADLARLAVEIRDRLVNAEREIIIVTPYFIPGDAGAELLEDIVKRKVRVVVVTNSMASTNHLPVHAAYSRYRERLLRAGIEIYEIKANNTGEKNAWGYKPEMVTLHSKATLIDREVIFVGSLNFDPRSIELNTEMGLFIESAAVGEEFAVRLENEIQRVAYQVELMEDDQLRWTYNWQSTSETHTTEPLSSWGQRRMTTLYRLIPEGQL